MTSIFSKKIPQFLKFIYFFFVSHACASFFIYSQEKRKMFHTCTQQESNRDNIAHFICEKARHTAAAVDVRACEKRFICFLDARIFENQYTNLRLFEMYPLYYIFCAYHTHTHTW